MPGSRARVCARACVLAGSGGPASRARSGVPHLPWAFLVPPCFWGGGGGGQGLPCWLLSSPSPLPSLARSRRCACFWFCHKA